ncbi:MAG: Fatty acid hydroxylase superfamily [Rhodobacteraceae bacterium HLUCCO18]|nr:MAG: Fatty acid hydroxylase superfamily [Rhodobacteraceae bacterium HLUCCO18]
MEPTDIAGVAGTVLRIATSDNFLMTMMVVPMVIVIERLISVRRVSGRHYRFGMLYFLVNASLIGLLAPAITYTTASAVRLIGDGLIDLRALGFPGLVGSLLALLVTTFVLDFFYYWFHRTMHYRLFWPMHELHHSDENMNALTAQRGHILETLISPLFLTLPMAILFRLPALDIAILSLIPQAYHFLSHANIRLSYGPLWWLLISPDYHRIHHSIEPRHHHKNFANWFPIWDILFGTAWRPDGTRPDTGVQGVEINTLRQAYLLPFKGWYRMIQRRVEETRADVADIADSNAKGNDF